MSTCDDVRTMIAIGDTEDALVQHHLPSCAECTRYAESDAAIERFVAGNVILTPPPNSQPNYLPLLRIMPFPRMHAPGGHRWQ